MTEYNLDGFKDCVMKMTKEWVAEQGMVTCEFSTNGEMLAEKLKFVHDNAPKDGRWTIQYCETCREHGQDYPFHVQIEHV